MAKGFQYQLGLMRAGREWTFIIIPFTHGYFLSCPVASKTVAFRNYETNSRILPIRSLI